MEHRVGPTTAFNFQAFSQPPPPLHNQQPTTLSHPPPPPPFALHAPLRPSQSALTHDPFIPSRKIQSGDNRQDTLRALSQAPSGGGSYNDSISRDVLGNATTSIPPHERQAMRQSSGPHMLVDGKLRDIHRAQALQDPSNITPLPPPPPPPSSTFSSIFIDPATRSDSTPYQQHRKTPPRMYSATQEPPPPPPPFSGRPMLPPSPPYSNAPPLVSRVPPPPPCLGIQEKAAVAPATRSESSMSISSMLDSAPGRPSRESALSTNKNGASSLASYTSSAHQSHPASSPTRLNNGHGSFATSSPVERSTSSTPGTRSFRAFSGGEPPQRIYHNSKAGPLEGSRFGLASNASPVPYSPRSDSGGQKEWRTQNSREFSVGRIIHRPSSQPNGQAARQGEMTMGRPETTASQMAEKQKQQGRGSKEEHVKYTGNDRVSSFDHLGRQAQIAQIERQHRLEQEQAKKPSKQGSPQQGLSREMDYPFLAQASVFSEPSAVLSRLEKMPATDRLHDHSHLPQSKAPPQASLSDETLKHVREDTQRPGQPPPKYSPTALRYSFVENGEDRPPQTYPLNPESRTASQDTRSAAEGTGQQLRSLINDSKQRMGRVSPLPQAVQGAQGQKRGPSSDPSIKNEFSRMFAGIGSGVGSAGLNSGASTPFPPSPKQNSEADRPNPLSARGDLFEARARNGSRIGKRARKTKDDEPKDIEIVESRNGGINGSRNVKRSRLAQPHHHHTSDHRHHHHRVDDENTVAVRKNGNSATPVPRRHHLHHHHHPDGTIHYHSHAKPTPKPPRIPTTKVTNDSVLEAIRDRPRRHLGTVLYSPPTVLPAPSDSKLDYVVAPYTIPQYEGKENCTLTVRVPRFYLDRDHREQVTLGRAVWGTDVYSDDSDPLAAAIHAGWIRGEWGDGIDFSMLEITPPPTEPKTSNASETTISNLPPTPILPPPNKDLHLTLLILPTLQNYTSHIAHGIKSRAWGSDHDGMSFRIEKLQWVEARPDGNEGKDGETRRKRIKMSRDCTIRGPPVKLGLGKGVSGKGVVSAAA